MRPMVRIKVRRETRGDVERGFSAETAVIARAPVKWRYVIPMLILF